MLLNAKITITDRGNLRRLMEITESKKDGSVYIKNNSGMQEGIPPNHKLIKEERYSIHPSDESPLYSTILNHHYFVDDTQGPTALHYTNAIKLKAGFTPVVHIRYPDFITPQYEIGKIKKDTVVINFGEVDASAEFLYVSIFVGHPETEFPLPEYCEFTKFEIITNRFRLVFLVSVINLPAIPFAFMFNFCSHGGPFDPGHHPTPNQCQFDTVEDCIKSHKFYCQSVIDEYFQSIKVLKQVLDDRKKVNRYVTNPFNV